MTATEQVAVAIERFRFRYVNEKQLQEGLADVLSRIWKVEREVRLSPRERVDLMVRVPGESSGEGLLRIQGGDGPRLVAVEVKVSGKAGDVLKQCRRYCEKGDFEGLVLVTNRIRHALPGELHGKELRVVSLVQL